MCVRDSVTTSVACGVCDRDHTVDLRGALKPIQRNHYPAFDSSGTVDPDKVGALLRAIDGFEGYFATEYALRLHPLVATRPGELRHAEWSEFDLDSAIWDIPAGRMKMKKPHIVPLSPQAVAIIKELQEVSGESRYLFPSIRSTKRPISDNTMNAAIRRLGFSSAEFVCHGWRAVFRTLADEVLNERVEYLEAQTAHQVKDTLGRAYNRTSFLKERKAIMHRWSNYLDRLKHGNEAASPEQTTVFEKAECNQNSTSNPQQIEIQSNPNENAEQALKIIIRKITTGEKLTEAEKALLKIWTSRKPGRAKGHSNTHIENALLFKQMRPPCRSDRECYKKMQEEYEKNEGITMSADAFRKSVEIGKKELSEIQSTSFAESDVLKDIASSIRQKYQHEVIKSCLENK